MHPEDPRSGKIAIEPGVRRASGFSLIELIVAIVVVSIGLTGALLVTDHTTRHSADPMIEVQALSIAEAYLEEILLQSFEDPDDGAVCGFPEASRALLDDVCDYDGLDDAGAVDQNGSGVSGLADYRVEIDIDQSANLGAISGSSDLLRVDVAVSHPIGTVVRLSGYRTRY